MSSSPAVNLQVGATLKEGIGIGIKNIGPILVNVLLWGLTVWIPYLNVGTTIGLMVGIVSKASKDEVISFTEIFDAKYRKYMGEYFLTAGLVGIGVAVGMVFFIIPGCVIALAWSLALLLAIDKEKNPTEAITLSNHCTYGNKGKMFLIYFLVGIVLMVVLWTIVGTGFAVSSIAGVMFFLAFLVCLFAVFVCIGIQASIYKQLAASV